jgi:hypothetical protein
LKYNPDVRPVAQFASVDPSYITPANPYGYNNGPEPEEQWRRFDKLIGCQNFVNKLLPGMQSCNYQGVILWQPQGIHPRGGQYRPDFNIFPSVTIPNLPTLTSGFRNAGKSVGLLSRPGVTITSFSWDVDGFAELSVDKSGIDDLLARFTWAISHDFNIFYLDSFTSFGRDLPVLKAIRAHLGPEVQMFCESVTVADMEWTAAYGEFNYDSGVFHAPERQNIFRWLLPEVPWIMQFRSGLPPGGYPELFDYMLSNRLTPLIQDYQVSSDEVTIPLAPLVAEHIDENNQWRN